MPAYFVALVDIKDEEKFRAYQGVAGDVFATYGAKFLTRGGAAAIRFSRGPKRREPAP